MNSKMALVALVSTLSVASLAAPQMGTMTDPRDGQTYKTVKIGDQVWMAENLNYETYGMCYDNNPQNCTKYGRLYSKHSLSQVCPNGWHLPDSLEFIILLNELDLRTFKLGVGSGKNDTLDFFENAGNYLKSTTGWNDYEGSNGNGSNLAGFSAIPGGNMQLNRALNRLFHFLGASAFFWTSDYIYVQETHDNVVFALVWASNYGVLYKASFDDSAGFSVRCIKDDKKGKEKLDSLRKEISAGFSVRCIKEDKKAKERFESLMKEMNK